MCKKRCFSCRPPIPPFPTIAGTPSPSRHLAARCTLPSLCRQTGSI
nr:MAG TPA: Proline-rich membrane anchor 1 [Caudoviricetes sp.]